MTLCMAQPCAPCQPTCSALVGWQQVLPSALPTFRAKTTRVSSGMPLRERNTCSKRVATTRCASTRSEHRGGPTLRIVHHSRRPKRPRLQDGVVRAAQRAPAAQRHEALARVGQARAHLHPGLALAQAHARACRLDPPADPRHPVTPLTDNV